MFVAYADRRGVLGFCHEQIAPGGTIIVMENEDLDLLQEQVCVVARHAYNKDVFLVPGVPEATDDAAAFKALVAWVSWAFPGFAYRHVGESS